MNKTKLKKAIRIALPFLVAFLILCGVPAPAFASMGSTGGGSTGGGGGSDYTSDSSGGGFEIHSVNDPWTAIIGFVIMIVFIVAFVMLMSFVSDLYCALRIWYKYNSKFLFDQKYKRLTDIFDYPARRIFFDSAFSLIKSYKDLKTIPEDNASQKEWQKLADVYIQSQFTYSQLIRERLVNKHASVKFLKQYLDWLFYRTMVREINLKVDSKTVDDTVVDEAKVVQVFKYGDLYITKIKAKGKDKEIQFNHDFDSSFTRSEWCDYIIYGKERNTGKIKIINLMYGEHAHLNGEDFNSDSSLDKNSKFEERHYDDLNNTDKDK